MTARDRRVVPRNSRLALPPPPARASLPPPAVPPEAIYDEMHGVVKGVAALQGRSVRDLAEDFVSRYLAQKLEESWDASPGAAPPRNRPHNTYSWDQGRGPS